MRLSLHGFPAAPVDVAHLTLTFIMLGPPLLISGTPGSFLLSGERDQTQELQLTPHTGCGRLSSYRTATMITSGEREQ